jgi:hypothetical protein
MQPKGIDSGLTSIPQSSNGMVLLGFTNVTLRGITLFSSIRTVLIKPANPATLSVCPTFALTLPMNSFFPSCLPLQNVSFKDLASISSPAVVPVPVS